MRVSLLICALALSSSPAWSQTSESESPAQVGDADEAPRIARWVIRRDTTLDDQTVEVRLDSLGARLGGLFGPGGPIGTRMRRFEIELDGDTPSVRFQTTDDGVDSELSDRARRLERDARRLAEAYRSTPSRETERELDETLSELFDLRGTIRQQRAAALRARADALRDQAAALDREAQRRGADRDRVIAARKRELLDDGAAADW